MKRLLSGELTAGRFRLFETTTTDELPACAHGRFQGPMLWTCHGPPGLRQASPCSHVSLPSRT